MRAHLPLLILATVLLAAPATADKKDRLQEARPPVFEALINCRTITDAQDRLACYDAKVAAMDEAEKNDELVLADKETMKEARRGLFGFSLPKLKLFDNADGKGSELQLHYLTEDQGGLPKNRQRPQITEGRDGMAASKLRLASY